MSLARQKILNKLKSAVHSVPEKPDFDKPIYHQIDKPLELAFKENLEKVNGFVHLFPSEEKLYAGLKKFLKEQKKGKVVCNEEQIGNKLMNAQIEFINSVKLPEDIQIGITSCDFLIAHTGSVMVSSVQAGGRQMLAYSPVHVVMAHKNQLVENLDKAYSGIAEKYKNNFPSQVALITGPSRTADIEKTMVLGAHGPRELIVFMVV